MRSVLAAAWAERRWEIAAVAGLFFVSALYLCVQALRVKTYSWFVDELLYTKAAQGFADSPFHPQIFSEPYPVPNALYPRLLALPYGLVSNLHAFTAGHLMNALLFASALVPVYILARRLGATQRFALVAGALAVWVPWALATLVLMSESLAYPAFTWAMLAGVVAIAEPRPRNDLLLAAAVFALIYSRTQFIVVLPAFAIALVVHEIAWPERRAGDLKRRARGHWVLGVFILLGLLSWFVLRPDFLGNYTRTTQIPRFPTLLLDSMADHLSHVVIGAGVVPALLWFAAIVRGASTPARREQHVFAYLSGLAALLLVYQAGFYSRQIAGGNLQERYMFYIAALFAAGAAMILSDRIRRPPIGSLVAAAAVAIPVIAAANYPPGVGGVRAIESGASAFDEHLIDFAVFVRPSWTISGTMAALVVVVALLAAAALSAGAWRRFTLPALAAATLLFCALETNSIFDKVIPEVNTRIPTVLGHPPKAWVDGLLYKTGDDAGAIEGHLFGDEASLWQWTEFWNSRIKRVYSAPIHGPWSTLGGTPLTVDPDSGRIKTPVEMPMLVVAAGDPVLAVQGETIRTIVTGQRLIRPVRPYRAAWVYGDARTAAVGRKPTELSIYPPKQGVRSAHVVFDLLPTELPGKPRPVKWVATSGEQRFSGLARPRTATEVALDVEVDRGAARGIVSLSAPEAREKPLFEIGSLRVDWGP